MRRPFILFLLFLSLFCWLKDLVRFFFYFFHVTSLHEEGYGTAAGILGVLLFLYVVKVTIYKDSTTPKLKDQFQIQRGKEWLLLLFVSTPVILLGLYRSIYPDQNFDTFHFELYLQEYDLSENKINFAAGAIRTYYFPLSERIFGLFRHLLGYRLGTLFNVFLLIAIIASVYDLIKKLFSRFFPDFKPPAIFAATMALFAIFADNTLFNIGSYKPDLIGVPFILELFHLILKDKRSHKIRDHLFFFLIVSLVITYKLTYLPYVALLSLVYYINQFRKYSAAEKVLYPLSVLLVPSIYLLYNFIETANPIFPFFNKIIHSGLYPYANFKDERWGPQKFYEIFIYPVVTYLDRGRANEWHLYSYRLLAGYFMSVFLAAYCLFKGRRPHPEPFLRLLLYLCLTAIAFDYFCIITTGYYRYGIIVEILYGIVLCAGYLYFRKSWFGYFFLLIMLLQSYDTFKHIFVQQMNLSWHDYRSLLHDKKALKNNTGLFLHDYSEIRDPDNILPKIDAFVSTGPLPADGLAKLLNKNVPIYDLAVGARAMDLTNDFEKSVVRVNSQTKTLMTVIPLSNFGDVFQSLNAKGYEVTKMYEVYPRFMKSGEPVFLCKIKYLDTSRFIIKYSDHYLRNENTPAGRNNFSYQSSNTMQVFIREDPFAYSWCCLAKSYSISINGDSLFTRDGFENNKIFSVEGNHLQFHKSDEIPYLIIVEEIIPKSSNLSNE